MVSDSLNNTAGGKNYFGLDITKFIMSIIVVAIHTDPLANCKNEYLNFFVYSVFEIAVPFFFITSGFLLARKFSDPFYSSENQSAVKKYLLRIFKIYIVWTAIYLPLAVYSYSLENNSVLYNIMITLRKIVFRGDNYNSWQLWYLLSTVYALLFILISMKLKRKQYFVYSAAVVAFIAQKLINYIAWTTDSVPTWLTPIKTLIYYTFSDGRVLSGIYYIAIGMFIWENMRLIKNVKFVLIPCIIISFFLKNEIILSLFTVIETVAVFTIAANVSLKEKTIYKELRTASTAIYLIHMYIVTFVCLILKNENSGFKVFVLSALFSALVSFGYIFIRKKLAELKA